MNGIMNLIEEFIFLSQLLFGFAAAFCKSTADLFNSFLSEYTFVR